MTKLAIVGATGLVGQTLLKVLEERNLPIDKYVFLASKKSKDKKIIFKGHTYKIKELTENSFKNINYAIFVAGGEVAKKFASIAIKNNCTVIDNSSAFRLDPSIPLIVPEVNYKDLSAHKGLIANPNCSTIQSVIPLKILNDNYKIKRVVYSTYQAVSGAGQKGIEDLLNTANGLPPLKFYYPIYNNCIPQIDTFLENGYTKEEEKIINETRKILNLPKLKITATAVRVPVQNSHSISINAELKNSFKIEDIINLFKNNKNIIVKNNSLNNEYPITTDATGRDEIFIRKNKKRFYYKKWFEFLGRSW